MEVGGNMKRRTCSGAPGSPPRCWPCRRGCGGGKGQGLDGGPGGSGSAAAAARLGPAAGGQAVQAAAARPHDAGLRHPVHDRRFLVDGGAQTELTQRFPGFITALDHLPGGLPNVHIAVISSDMGAGAEEDQRLRGNGNNGVFQYTPRVPCTKTTLNGGATYIVNANGTANYTAPRKRLFLPRLSWEPERLRNRAAAELGHACPRRRREGATARGKPGVPAA